MSNSTTADPNGGDPETDGTDSGNSPRGVLGATRRSLDPVIDPLLGALVRARRILDPVIDPLLGALVAVRRSFLLFVAVVGIVLIALGALIDGLFAGMFGIWGGTALICAGVGFVVVQVLKILDA